MSAEDVLAGRKSWHIEQSDVLAFLATLPTECVQCCITSPPYWSLRDYGTGTWEGGTPTCDHRGSSPSRATNSKASSGLNGGKKTCHLSHVYKDVCGRCGARRMDLQLGIENLHDCNGAFTGRPCGECFVCHLVGVFREVKRVLRDDGLLWLNLGDSYASGHEAGRPPGLKPKDLCMTPARVALALQADGWWVRSDLPWVKRSPMPESARDRPSKALEHVYLLAKSERYFFDMDAVKRESASFGRQNSSREGTSAKNESISREWHAAPGDRYDQAGRNWRDADPWFQSLGPPWGLCGVGDELVGLDVTSEPLKEAHFACVDQDTDCLTATGWKKWNEVQPGDVAAQYDVETETISWGSVQAVNAYPVVNQEMIAVKHVNVSMLLTPNHRAVIRRRHPDTRQYQKPVFVRADELKAGHAVPISAPWSPTPSNQGIGEDWAELLGWYVAEGSEPKASGWGVDIYQSPSANPEKTERIRQLLLAVEAEFREATATRFFRGEPGSLTVFHVTGYGAIRLRELAPGKCLSWSLLGLPEVELAAILRGLIGGDGHTRLDDGRQTFIQKSAATVDFVQALACRLGYATKASWRSTETFTVFFTGKRHICLRGTNGKNHKSSRETYTGVVWCPTMPKGTWVARKNGRVFITGNSFPRELVRPMLLASTPERGCCPACGQPWRRVVERERRATRPGSSTKVKVPSGWDTGPGAHGSFHRDGRAITPEYRDAAEVGNRDPRRHVTESRTTGWAGDCACPPADPVPSICLDPFSGAGTVALVCLQEGRRFVGCDLSPEYVELSRKRLNRETGLLAWGQ